MLCNEVPWGSLFYGFWGFSFFFGGGGVSCLVSTRLYSHNAIDSVYSPLDLKVELLVFANCHVSVDAGCVFVLVNGHTAKCYSLALFLVYTNMLSVYHMVLEENGSGSKF